MDARRSGLGIIAKKILSNENARCTRLILPDYLLCTLLLTTLKHATYMTQARIDTEVDRYNCYDNSNYYETCYLFNDFARYNFMTNP